MARVDIDHDVTVSDLYVQLKTVDERSIKIIKLMVATFPAAQSVDALKWMLSYGTFI